jgi:hypothetical protein
MFVYVIVIKILQDLILAFLDDVSVALPHFDDKVATFLT